MKKITFFIVMLFCMIANAQNLPRIAVYATGGASPSDNRMVANEITHALVESRQYTTIERADEFIARVEQELTTQRSGAVVDSQIVAVGERFGAQFVCVVEMVESETFSAYQIAARIVNVRTVAITRSGRGMVDKQKGRNLTLSDFRRLSQEVVGGILGISGGTQQAQQRQQHTTQPAPAPAPRPQAPPPPPPTPPATPTGVRANATSPSSITVSWNAVSGATGYRVYSSTSASGTFTQLTTTSSTSLSNTRLSANTTYYYRVAAYNNVGTSSQSSTVNATTQPILPAPVNVRAEANSSNLITVIWDTVSGARGYYVYRSSSASGTFTQVGSEGHSGYHRRGSHANSGLSANTTYFYRVAAYNNLGTGAQSNTVSATTQSPSSGIQYGSFTDPRDNKTYRTVIMPDGKTWMAENLNYRNPSWRHNDVTGKVGRRVKGSWCLDNNPANCNTYGRLYTFQAALEACPAGWRLPSATDWNRLMNAISERGGNFQTMGMMLRTADGWRPRFGNQTITGTNEYGFSALPGGYRGQRKHVFFGSDQTSGYWWGSPTKTKPYPEYGIDMHGHVGSVSTISIHHVKRVRANSIRCIRDD